MNKEIFCSAVSEGIASILSELSTYPISRFNDSLQGKRRDQWSPYKFINLMTEIKSLILTAFPYGFVFDVSFIHSYSAFRNKLKLPHRVSLAMGATVSECLAEFIKIPLVNISQIVQNEQITSFKSALSTYKKTQGFKGLYEGYLPTIISTVPFYCTVIPIFDQIKSHVMKNKKKFKINDCIWISAVSITIGNFVTNPIDVLTANLQEAKKSLCYCNYMKEFSSIMKSGNAVSQLYKNLSQKHIFGIAGIVYMTSYETLNAVFQKDEENF